MPYRIYCVTFLIIPFWALVWCIFPLGVIRTAVFGILYGAVFVSAYTDFRWRRIYNPVTYPAFLWLIGLNIVGLFGDFGLRIGNVGIGSALLGAVACLGITAIPYMTGSGGAGDAKLGAVIGAALGVEMGIITILISYIIAGLMAVVIVIWDRGLFFIAGMLYHRLGHIFLPIWIPPVSEEHQKVFEEPFPMAPSFLAGIILISVPQIRVFFE
jgi:Flp pilus assembly protein protease CpaA